jgi:CRISPR-associated endonuclease/helicase Cas3
MIDCEEFLGLIHGDRDGPYPWQLGFGQRCLDGALPRTVALPTGAGKTTVVDVLVWALAHRARRPAAERTVGVRIVWAIDRRILVDEVHEHARRLQRLLEGALQDSGDPLHEIAESLAWLSGGGPPLVATRWRGGLAERPERHGPLQPQIITSTVAQIGSRLLFRGFGVGERSLALEAGLAACDTTICLDESHLAEPFRETVDAICAIRRESEQVLALPGLRVITITATPPTDDDDDAVRLGEGDRKALGARWNGRKRAVLLEPESVRDVDCVKALTAATLEDLAGGARTVACIANTVRRAREVFAALREKLSEEEADVGLLIGPQRPADRDRFLNAPRRAVLFGGEPSSKPLVVVATQTFEVGLDADVAAMVSESASATALVQRLGRLNRRGLTDGRATIVRDANSWLYGDEERLAWDWLRLREEADGTIDVSVAALHEDATRPPAKHVAAPMLTREIIELLAQTDPRPYGWAEPEVEEFLRGVESEPSADVALCWRCDLRLDVRSPEADGYRKMLLKLVPPHRQELLRLSVTSARALLRARFEHARTAATTAARAALADADVEGETVDMRVPEVDGAELGTAFMVLRRGRVLAGALEGAARRIGPGDLAPGDVIVLPTGAGGADEYGLAPHSPRATDVARDLVRGEAPSDASDADSDEAASRRGPPAPVRITPGAVEQTVEAPLTGQRWEKIARACRKAEPALLGVRDRKARAEILDKLLVRLRGELPTHPGLASLEGLRPDERLALRAIGPVQEDGSPALEEDELEEDEAREGGERLALSPGDPLRRAWVLMVIPPGHRDWEERVGSNGDGPPTLDAHARAVCEEVAKYAQRLELPEVVAGSLRIAARGHDHGKADPRIQAFYRYGVEALAAEPIAKSEFGTRDPRAESFARELAGLPEALRHEIASVAAVAYALQAGAIDESEFDPELVLYLVAVHHGLGRGIPRVPHGGSPPREFRAEAAGIVGVALGDGRDGWANGAWLERFSNVLERYGPWGIAYLEGLLVSADRAVSARGQ